MDLLIITPLVAHPSFYIFLRNLSGGQDTVSLLSQASNNNNRNPRKLLSMRDVMRHSPMENEAVRWTFSILLED
jgi:hypothetical protein